MKMQISFYGNVVVPAGKLEKVLYVLSECSMVGTGYLGKNWASEHYEYEVPRLDYNLKPCGPLKTETEHKIIQAEKEAKEKEAESNGA